VGWLMARCTTKTGLPLDTWAAILGISPWEFNQCSYPFTKSAQCSDVIFQFPWQKDHLSREEIGEAIAEAEAMLAQELLYWPYPRYTIGEVVAYPRPHQPNLFGYAGDIRGDLKTVQLKNHMVITGGAMNRTFIGQIAGADLTKIDNDGDGVYETFQAVITDAAVGLLDDPYELALYFSAGNRHGERLDETWRIRPLTISITGNTATITGHRTLLINPQIEYAANAEKLNPATDANYVVTVECYRVFTDTTATAAQPYQGVAEWKTNPYCNDRDGCTYEGRELCLGMEASGTGHVWADFGEPCVWPYEDRDPDRLRVNYLAGVPLVDGRIEGELARMTTYLSVSLLANEKCGCDRSNRILARWKEPVRRFQDNNGEGAEAFSSQRNTFPMTVGGQYAFNRVKRMRDLESVGI
jgi:hypothetical protein